MRHLLILGLVLMVSACGSTPWSESAPQVRGGPAWNMYYARTDIARRHVQVLGPTGTTRPMAGLIAEDAAHNLRKLGVDADVGPGGPGRHFVLSGEVKHNTDDPRVRYVIVIHWLLTDANGRVVGSHVQGIDGTETAWSMGDPRLIRAAGSGVAVPVADMVQAEVGKPMPADPLRQGVMVRDVSGLNPADTFAMTEAIMAALRGHDVLVTRDPRQAVFALQGQVEHSAEPDGLERIKITWRVLTLDGGAVGYAVQEKQVRAGSLDGRWARVAPAVAATAVDGIERIFGPARAPYLDDSVGPGPSAPRLPQVPGRAMPPPPG